MYRAPNARAGGDPRADDAAPVRRLLLISADPQDQALVSELCRESGRLQLDVAASLDEALPQLERWSHDAYLADLFLGGGGSALDLLAEAERAGQKAPVLLLTGVSSRAMEARALHAGAADLLMKGRLDAEFLERAVHHAVERRQAAKRLRVLERVATAANEAEGEREALEAALVTLTRHTRWSAGQVWLATADGRLMEGGVRIPHHARAARLDPVFLEPGEGLAGRAARGRKLLYAPAGAADPRWHSGEGLVGVATAAAIAVPIQLRGRVEAVLCLYSPDPRQPETVMADLMRQVATQLGHVMDRERGRDALREKEELLERILQTSTDGVLMLDRGGRVSFSNAAARSLLGLEGEAGPGARLSVIPFHEVIQAGAPVHNRDVEVPPVDGGPPRVLSVSAAPLRAGDTVQGVVAVLRDVTEARQAADAHAALEAQLRQSQKMEAVGRLAGGVAHDFNNLLTTITGLTDLLLADVPPADPRRGDLETIQHTALRASDLTRQLLSLSRRRVLQPRPVDLVALIGGLEKMLHRLIGEDVSLETRLPEGSAWVLADPSQMEQVLLNLVINARDAMPAGGRVRLSVRRDVLDEERARRLGLPPGDAVALEVSDTGAGMDDETRSRIFEPFFTTKPPGKGTGLGMSTVYGIVTQSGGQIEVESAPGRGATFRVCLPAVGEGARAAAPPRGRLTRTVGGGETLLLVEDDEGVRSLARRTLEEAGYRVLAARDGTEALAVAGRYPERIHLLVTDVVMPWMSGRELAEALTATVPDLQVLFTSGYTGDPLTRHGIREEEEDFLEKPFRLDVLLLKVREILDRAEAPEHRPPPPPA